MARETGILEDWHDARGFGFIRRPGGAKLYVHMKSIGKSTERPKPGDTLSYEIGEGANGRAAALNVKIVGSPAPPPQEAAPQSGAPAAAPAPVAPRKSREAKPGLRQISMRTAAAATIIVLLGNNIMLGRFPVWVGLLYAIGGIASWLFYQADKRAAEKAPVARARTQPPPGRPRFRNCRWTCSPSMCCGTRLTSPAS